MNEAEADRKIVSDRVRFVKGSNDAMSVGDSIYDAIWLCQHRVMRPTTELP